MSFLEIAKKRYSARKYEKKKVEQDKLMTILEAGRVAPTGANLQPQRLIVVQEEAGLAKIGRAGNIYGAPLAIIACADKDVSWKRPYDGKKIDEIDATIVTDHMMLQATELGLGTVWVCWFDPEVIIKEFNLPSNLVPVNILAIGYASDTPASPERHARLRKPLNETVFFERL